jgi:hypothetical protein
MSQIAVINESTASAYADVQHLIPAQRPMERRSEFRAPAGSGRERRARGWQKWVISGHNFRR